MLLKSKRSDYGERNDDLQKVKDFEGKNCSIRPRKKSFSKCVLGLTRKGKNSENIEFILNFDRRRTAMS